MLVIVSVSRLDNDRIEIGVARPQHDSNPTHNYHSQKEVRAVLSDFGISEELIAAAPQIAGTNGRARTIKISSNGCSTEPTAVERISIVIRRGQRLLVSAAPTAQTFILWNKVTLIHEAAEQPSSSYLKGGGKIS